MGWYHFINIIFTKTFYKITVYFQTKICVPWETENQNPFWHSKSTPESIALFFIYRDLPLNSELWDNIINLHQTVFTFIQTESYCVSLVNTAEY